MERRPLVSVVIATRNRPDMLQRAVDAVMQQRYEGPLECLVVFDQSPIDPTIERDDPHRAVRAMSNSRTPGLAGARNTGVVVAAGELIAFCDDDDVWRDSKLERQVATLGVALTSVTGITIDYGGRRAERIPTPESMTLAKLVRNRSMEAHPSTVVVRRDALLNEIGLVDEEIPGSYAEDFDLMIRAVQAGPVAVVEEPLVDVHWGQSLFSRDWATIVRAVDYLIEKHEVFRADPRALARLYGRRAFAQAAMGDRRQSLRDSWRSMRCWPFEKRAYVALVAATGVVSAPRLLDLAHRRGVGI